MLDPLADDKLYRLLSETVDNLVDGYVTGAAEGLRQIATYMARAGFCLRDFEDLRRHLVESAQAQAGCPIMIESALRAAEREAQLQQRRAH